MLFWDYVLGRWASGMAGGHDLVGVSEIVAALIFAWIALRSERWWMFVVSAALMLCVLVFLLEWTRPSLSEYAAISARLGLWFIIHLALIAGVAERWLSGEAAVCRIRSSSSPASRRAGSDWQLRA